jgi:hypothetical protein
MTESGKTTLAKKMSRHYRDRKIKILVLDPLLDPDWCADYITDNPYEFLSVYFNPNTLRCAVFIDEAGENVGNYDYTMIKTATRGRHWGHSNHYCSQRGTQIARTVRDQCSNLFLFATALEDCKIHAREWNNEKLLSGAKLQQGEFFHTTRFGEITRGNSYG